MLVVPAAAAFVAKTVPAGWLSGGGLLVAAVGILWLAQLGSEAVMLDLVGPLVVIGIGAAFPWGLMDGLSVTVVPSDKAGMASGIFNTTKVASEGITLAIVNALLAGLVLFSVNSNLGDPGNGSATGTASRQLAAGGLDQAARILDGATRDVLVASYDSAFSALLYLLAAVTIASAIAVLILLSKKAHP